MELVSIEGRKLKLNKDETSALAQVCATLDTMATVMTDADYGTLVDRMTSTEYFNSLCDDEGNELVDEFMGQGMDCQNILTILSEFLYLLYEATAQPTV